MAAVLVRVTIAWFTRTSDNEKVPVLVVDNGKAGVLVDQPLAPGGLPLQYIMLIFTEIKGPFHFHINDQTLLIFRDMWYICKAVRSQTFHHHNTANTKHKITQKQIRTGGSSVEQRIITDVTKVAAKPVGHHDVVRKP